MRTELIRLVGMPVFTLAGTAQAQFTWTTNSGTITITGYAGPGVTNIYFQESEHFSIAHCGAAE